MRRAERTAKWVRETVAYVSTRSSRKLWWIVLNNPPLRWWALHELRKRRDDPSRDAGPDCDSPLTIGESPYVKKGTRYADVGW